MPKPAGRMLLGGAVSWYAGVVLLRNSKGAAARSQGGRYGAKVRMKASEYRSFTNAALQVELCMTRGPAFTYGNKKAQEREAVDVEESAQEKVRPRRVKKLKMGARDKVRFPFLMASLRPYKATQEQWRGHQCHGGELDFSMQYTVYIRRIRPGSSQPASLLPISTYLRPARRCGWP